MAEYDSFPDVVTTLDTHKWPIQDSALSGPPGELLSLSQVVSHTVSAGTVVVQANSFAAGDIVSLAAPWIKASSDSRTAPASAVVLTADAGQFEVETLSGRVVPLPSHGLGVAGVELWLGLAAAFSNAKPPGATGKVFQRVGRIWSPDAILFNLEQPDIR